MRYAIHIYSSGGDLGQGYYNLTLYFDTLEQAIDYEKNAGIGFLNISEVASDVSPDDYQDRDDFPGGEPIFEKKGVDN